MREGFLTKWYWVDGKGDFTYTNWAATPSVPATGDYCVVYSYSATTKKGTWTYALCSQGAYFICEY